MLTFDPDIPQNILHVEEHLVYCFITSTEQFVTLGPCLLCINLCVFCILCEYVQNVNNKGLVVTVKQLIRKSLTNTERGHRLSDKKLCRAYLTNQWTITLFNTCSTQSSWTNHNAWYKATSNHSIPDLYLNMINCAIQLYLDKYINLPI